MTEMTINKLPSKTWYWLHVNETKLPWDKEHTTELPEETVTAGSTEEVRFSITGEGRYSSKKIHIIAPAGKQVTVFMDYQTEEKLAVRTSPFGGRTCTGASGAAAAHSRKFSCVQSD